MRLLPFFSFCLLFLSAKTPIFFDMSINMDVFSFKPLQYFPEVVTSISVILFLLKFFPLNPHQMKEKTQKTLSPKILLKKI
jgi:hypothetical protein